MNILNLLIKEKRVAGVEISDRVIRIAYFSPQKRFRNKIHSEKTKLPENELILIEEPIAANVILEGVVIDKEFLGKILKDIWSRAKLNSNYAIVSIPEDKVYSRIFPFPKTVNEEQLKDAVNIAIDFQLPTKKNDVYTGWENAGDSHINNEILISTIPKNIANGYIEALDYAGIKMLALESHIASIARSIKLKLGQATLFTKRSLDGATIFILKDGIIRFSRSLPATFIKEDSFLINEANHIKTSFESEKNMSVVELPLTKAVIRTDYQKYLNLNETNPDLQSKWLICMGAVIRGEIPKGKDNRISLLPVGTAEAYKYQKATTFIFLVRNLIAGIGIFFLITFLMVFLFIFSLSKDNKSIINPSTSPISEEVLQKENWIKKVNTLTEASQSILSTTINWSTLLDEIQSRAIEGITISNFTVKSTDKKGTIIGIARDRDTLNQFKKTLQESSYLSNVILPVTNLQQKGDIPYSISFDLKDLNMLYYK
jgi:hypothetical protein